MFIGGDPLLRDDFVELVDHITGTHEARARFFFNSLDRRGTGRPRWPRPDAAGSRRWRASTGRATINDALRGPGSYDDVHGVDRRTCWPPASSRWPTPCSCGRRCPASRSSRASCAPPGSAGSTSSCRTSGG